ncbi:hypothetical protein [Burkholderia multivorans]|uniref:Uncharacterized protein n=2 Tax=Burkholderia multivorans TaxID=87883 RepID=A0A0H3KB47_BURM1|nr:hypothetical protein [Burkholderia multivorans]ABX13720.1 conserved hypothetical protein [Burkholderia multivorans ATCC 17616]AIO75540.1 hypothetical protein DM80_1665 [Burkholderia multivorans]AOK66150.1 hypothetical protein WM33_10700 [Burkholderia multivorans]EED97919.1 hypothetical protein BURMUCGD1_3504 [Burkholderia multivorans CGD1]KGC06341.1 hypothetical protein DM81_4937 [Burkholderia multivorans]
MSKKLLLGAVIGVAALAASGVASAHVDLSVGIGVPGVYTAPAPVYVAPPPVAYAPVGYRYDDWRAREWREREWRRHEWREHEWRERDRGWRGGRWD